MTSRTFVIVGGGLAAARAVEALRNRGFEGRLILIATERHLPYQRPPLSKEFLAAKQSSITRAYAEADQRLTLRDFTVHDRDWYRSRGVELRLGTRVTALQPRARSVSLDDGTVVGYDKLLLATGARPQRPAIPGADAAGVHYLRTIDDAVALDAALKTASSLAVVGAGWLGLEVAASARLRGVAVTVVGRSELPLAGVLGAENAAVFAALHRRNGVDLRLGIEVTAITGTDGSTGGLTLTDGSHVGADVVLVATGADPNSELADQAGLAIEAGGVLVDASLRTSDPDIYAVGDVAAVQHPVLATTIRSGHWADARKQPTVAAAGMLGTPTEYTDLPYFFTDQYDLGMEYIGYAPEYHRVIFRGDVDIHRYVAFWLDAAGRVLAGMNVNVPGVISDLKKLVQSRIPIDPARLADPRLPLGSLLVGT